MVLIYNDNNKIREARESAEEFMDTHDNINSGVRLPRVGQTSRKEPRKIREFEINEIEYQPGLKTHD